MANDTIREAVNARLPKETIQQLQFLAEKYGTKTAVLIMAIRELYVKERNKSTKAERPPKKPM